MANSSTLSADSARSPLAHLTTMMENTSSSRVTVREEPFLVQINLRGNADDTAFLDGVKTATGLDLPLEPNTSTKSGQRMAIWLSPDEWVIVAPNVDEGSLLDGLLSSLEGQHVSIVDLSDNRSTLVLGGEAAWTVMNKGCPLDIDPVKWSAGKTAQTVYSRAQIVLVQTSDAPEFRIFVRNSFAEYLTRFIMENMREFA